MLHLRSEEFVNSELSFKVLNRYPQTDYPEHSHDNFSELVLINSGCGLHVINGKQKVIFPNTILCVSEKDYHLYTDNKDVNLVNILYDKKHLNLGKEAVNVIKKLEQKPTNFFLTEESFQPLNTLANNIYHEQSLEQQNLHAQSIQALMFEQLLLMIDRLNILNINYTPVMKAIIYLTNNYKSNDISIDHICETFQISPRTLNKSISQLTGLSTNKFLNQLRLKKAIRLIESGLSITEAAYYVGYNDSNYFSTKFKGMIGQSPRDFLKEISAKN